MFRGRGSAPSIGGRSSTSNGNSKINFNNDDVNVNVNNDDTISHYHPYIHYWRRYPYYRYDRNLIAIEIIATAFILLLLVTVVIMSYKPSFIDPIETIKGEYIRNKLVFLLITTLLTAFVFFLSKSKKTLIRNLTTALLLSIIVITIFIGIKFSLDTTYNEDKFSEFYETSEVKQNEKSDKIQNISIGLDGIKITNLRQYYINENMKAYKYFSYKSIAITVLYVIIIVFNGMMIMRLLKVEEKNDRLSKDDAILFDEEENVKI